MIVRQGDLPSEVVAGCRGQPARLRADHRRSGEGGDTGELEKARSATVLLLDAGVRRVLGAFVEAREYRILHRLAGDQVLHD